MADRALDDRARPTACTVVARNYLPAARVLARSYLDQHPGHRFVIAVIDATDAPGESTVDGYSIVGPPAFGIDSEDYLRMATAYSVTELATAVKPFLLRSLRTESDVVIYLDPDIQVFAPMPELVELAAAHQLVLTPHFLHPLPRDGKEPGEAVIMGTGMFNLGFLAVGPGSEEFLDFWALRLRQDAIVAPEAQLFTDQRWVDHVPSLFRHHVLRDPGFNVAYWNTHERPIERDEAGELTAAGHRLRFFHFSGYRPEKPWLLTFHCARNPRTLLSEHPRLRAICDDYGAALRNAGYAETLDSVPYGFATMADGTPLTRTIRRVFRAAWVDSERPAETRRRKEPVPPHGFGADGGAALREWLTAPDSPAQAGVGVGRLAMAVWESRPDLQAAFPRPNGVDAAAFRHWCRQSGEVEGALPAWASPEEPEPLSEPDDEFGVNVVGYLTAELGLGEMGRVVHDAIRRAGVAVSSVVEDRSLSNRTGVRAPETLGRPRFPVSLLCVNADQTSVLLENHPEVGQHRYRIGLWAWELEDFPRWQHPAFDQVDEVWTVSEFCRKAIAAHSSVPVHTIPVPIRDPGEPKIVPPEPGDPVRFLFAFDYNSIGQRKNPWGLVEAFRRAFADRDDARLVIKSINADLNTHAAERLRLTIAGDPRIELIERYLEQAELDELYATSHCYVSLHRSEGFGLTVAEAMARGLPVISTDYSGTTEFVDERTGWPIPYRMTKVGPGCYPYQADATWADPDLDAAATAMRQVADDPSEAARRGRAARAHVLATRSMAAASEWLRTQLAAAYQAWQQKRPAPAVVSNVAEPLRPLRESREALRWRPDTGSPSRLPMASALRRSILRAIDHYDVHQRSVMGALTDGTEAAAAGLLARIEALETRLAAIDSDQKISALGDRLSAVELAGDELRDQALHMSATLISLAARADAQDGVAAAVADLTGQLNGFREHVEESDKNTFKMFVERDRRADAGELNLQQLQRDVEAAEHAARLLHAPVPAGAEVVLCDAGALLVPDDRVFLPWLRYHRSWEPAEAELMAGLAGDGLFIDIGAHVGYHTLRLLRDCPNVAGVVAVEANPETVRLLERNLATNLTPAAAELVTVLPVAAWDENTTVWLAQAEPENSGDYRAHPEELAEGHALNAVRLDESPAVAAHRVSLIKVDLQGTDHRAIAGLSEILRRDRPHIVCEFSPVCIEADIGDGVPARVLLGYRELGYRPIAVDPDGTRRPDLPDAELIRLARQAESEFLTLWLKPQEPNVAVNP
jgi:FkbM family methyltransferase